MRVTTAIAAALVLIALATLLPGEPILPEHNNCLICGDRGVADAFLNLMLFVPLGAALAFGRRRPARILLAGLAVSMIIEVLQLLIPGRDPSAGDLLFNTAGALLGASTPFALNRWRTVPRASALWCVTALSLVALAVAVVTGTLLRPAFPERLYYGQWTPDFANTEDYRGHVVSAVIGDLKVRKGSVRRSRELRARLLQGDTLHLHVVAGPTPQHNSPVFNIYDDTQHEVLSIMSEGADLLVRYRMVATRLRLDQPTFTLRNGLADVHPEKPWSLRLQLIDGGICTELNGAAECPLGFSIARGWSVFLHTMFPRGVETALDVLWMALLFIPAGSYVTRRREAYTAIALCAVGLLVAGSIVELLPIRWYEVLAGLVGVAVGATIRLRATGRRHPSYLPGA